MATIQVGSAVKLLDGLWAGLPGTVVALHDETAECTIKFENANKKEKEEDRRLSLASIKVIGKDKKRKAKRTRATTKKDTEEEEDNDDIIDRVCNIVEERSRKKRVKSSSGRRTRQYLCEFRDGSEPRWIDAARLKATDALKDWKEAQEEEEEGEEEVPETFEPDDVVETKAGTLAAWLAQAKRPVFLLGAGVSAPVLPTFRGKNGLWTKNAHKNTTPQDCVAAQPTYTHRALVALEQAGHVYFCVTQNYDGLSNRSGFPRNKLSELHGNIFCEYCDRCGREYYRDFEVVLDDSVNHETGRKCEQKGCKGILRDNIVHFDEALPWHDLKMANAKFSGADLTIVLGSSLQVEPAAGMPFKSKRRHRNRNTERPRSVIVNLQPTPYDDEADLIIRGRTDDVFQQVAKVLGITVDP